MKLMRAIFECPKANIFEILAAYETSTGASLNLAIHDDSDEVETIVSGNRRDVMKLVGAVAERDSTDMAEAWAYEC